MASTMACSTTTCCKVRQAHRDPCNPWTWGAVHATRSIATRCDGGKDAGASAARGIKDRRAAPLLIALPEIPSARPLDAAPVHDVHDPFSPLQGHQRLRPPGHPLEDLPIAGDLLHVPAVRGLQSVSEGLPSSPLLLLLYKATIRSCASKSNSLNYLRYSPLEGNGA